MRVVPKPAATVSTLGFVSIIIALIAVGMAGVMVVTTSVSAQSRELAALRREATELGYQAAALESHLQRMSSANALAMRASTLGMVPNPHPAFINLADGTVTGAPQKATGREMPFLRGIAPAPIPGPPALPETTPAPAETDTELVAAGSTEAQQ
ncbi:MAG: hypothetical protein Q4G35_03410 [Propionibacteriaceae bacterium]|nr:hypothetical protein [Propionibacteriaceae bacterium]